MTKPLVITVPHELGRAEAKRRLEDGVGKLKATFGDKVSSVDETWSGDRLDVLVKALGQSVAAALQVREDHVQVEVQLPWALALVAEKAKGLIQRQGQLLLEKK